MVYVAIATVLLAVSLGANAQGMTPAQFGMHMSSQAYEAVCWYEYQKIFPNTNTKAYTQCTTQSIQKKDDIQKRIPVDQQQEYFSKWMPSTMGVLPSAYASKCGSLLESGTSETSDNEGDVLRDQGNVYPFRAFAYCMMKTLRERNGEEAIQAVKDERTHSLKDFASTLLERENAFRALHGSKPMQLEGTLMERAQKWSDFSASKCSDDHIPETHPEYLLNGKPTGENLAAGFLIGNEGDKSGSVYGAANGWYEEIKNYNWNGGPHRGVTGHFTQTVWRDHEYVGYGYAFNPNCNGGQGAMFITARYFPVGNMQGAFEENVKPRIK
ncbi:unnamed protein product [Orchesella dallaii]|uniref:SCP domain-containing protein n=1 Tax=Orchesella dallaii TaxID=48710 RepID=A0ABP1PNX7_9HEXA